MHHLKSCLVLFLNTYMELFFLLSLCVYFYFKLITDLTMYPPCPLPRHITALYMVAVMSSIALFSQSITIVGADILVYCDDPPEQLELEFRDMPSRFGDSLPIQGLQVC